MQTTFAGTTDIEEMIFTSQPKYNLEFAPTKPKPDYTVADMHPLLVSKLQDPDPSIPETKDLRKFVRRLPKLKLIRWTGRGGKGEWSFAKKTTLVSVSFVHSAVTTQRDWEICQLDPPFLEYVEPPTTRPTLLEMPPPAILSSSPIAEFPSLSRSTSASASSIRQPVTPGSPTHSKSLSIKEVNARLHGLGITPDEEDEVDIPKSQGIPASSSNSGPRRHQRRETTDGSIISTTGGSSMGQATNKSPGLNKGRQASLDMAKSTKRLVIGSEPIKSTTSTSFSTPMMLKTTSAPARTAGNSGGSGEKVGSAAPSSAGRSKGTERDSKGSRSSRGRKSEGSKHS